MNPKLVIIIDDDPINNKICSIYLKKTGIADEIKCFLNGKEGLDFLNSQFNPEDYLNVIVFLDLNMPIMNGWEFLEEYEKLPQNYKNKIDLYILSSSIDERDIIKSRENKSVIDFISKPFTSEILSSIKEKYKFE
ncbi:MAG: response regulator [Ignavibacteria bacterium]|nr:response regulator [Ignavibacteria bacterium]HCN36135.1 response regulator [Bacteroidota bacterium]